MEENYTIEVSVPERNSSIIRFIKWVESFDSSSTGSLNITFRSNGAKYIYKKVPLKILIGLLSADSIGKYFIKNIKTTYEFKQID